MNVGDFYSELEKRKPWEFVSPSLLSHRAVVRYMMKCAERWESFEKAMLEKGGCDAKGSDQEEGRG